MKISKKSAAKLDCICGACDHDCMNKNCLFNKIADSPHPEVKQREFIVELMKEVFEENKPKEVRAKIKTKKG